ncbi:MAG: PHP domain-containing protein [Candidatus Thorarchaeota archaeon]
MIFPKLNLHIHSTYSDGKQTIKQIVEKALELEMEYIAITDHFTNSWKAWVSILNNNEKISEYIQELSSFQKYLESRNEPLTLLKGIELDLASSEQFIKNYIKPESFDLLLLEYLEGNESIAFIKNLIHHWRSQISDFSKFPILGLAHFDPSHFILGDLNILMKFLKEYNIYFEFNSSYPYYYSTQYERFFEKLREFKIPVGIGCDSHKLKTLDDFEEPLEMIKYYSLQKNFEKLIKELALKSKNGLGTSL